MKTAVIAPSMLYLLYPLNGTVEGYPKEKFVEDLVAECEKDIRGCFEAGRRGFPLISLKVCRRHPKPKGQPGLLNGCVGRLASKKIPATLDRRRSAQNIRRPQQQSPRKIFRKRTRKHRHSHLPRRRLRLRPQRRSPLLNLLPSLFAMNAGYFLIQLASEKTKPQSTNRSANPSDMMPME